MKKILLIAILSFLFTKPFFGQQVIPMNKNRTLFRQYELKHSIRNLKRLQDTATLSEPQNNALMSASNELDTITDRVFIYGFGASDAVSQGNISANGGFSFGAQPHMWDRMFLSIGISGNVVKKEKQDSVSTTSIFFPDNASSVIYAYYEVSAMTLYRLYWKYNNKRKPHITDNLSDDLLLYGEASLQNRNIEGKDSSVHNFGIYNLAVGIKYRWTYDIKNKDKFSFDLGVGYGYTEISQQTARNFQSLVAPDAAQVKNIPTIYRGVNCITSIQYNDLIIYARLTAPVSTNGIKNYQHNVYFSTGIKITGTFFSF